MPGGPNSHGADPARVRNVVLVGPRASGKTTVGEALLHHLGAVSRLGSVDDGSTASDHTDVERRLGHSVHLSVATVDVPDGPATGGTGGVALTLLDSPGMPDFVGELRAGLRAADAALFVVSAADGIDASTRGLWRECAAVGMPRAVVVTHLDQPRAGFEETLAECREAFTDGVHPLYVPSGDGILALLSMTHRSGGSVREATDDERSNADAQRGDLVEAIITESEDESLLDRYLGGDEVGFDAIVEDLVRAVSRGAFHPLVPVTPTDGTGVAELLELVCRAFPTPADHPLPSAFAPNGGATGDLSSDPDGPLVAEVVKTVNDPYVGRLAVVRVFSGTLRPDETVHVSGHLAQFSGREEDAAWHADHDEDERVGAISRMLGATLSPVGIARAGDVVAVAHLSRAETGDTISAKDHPVVVEPWDFPHPLLPVAIRATSSKDEDKLVKAIGRLQAENPSAMIVTDPHTHQLVLWTMGDKQLEILLDSLRARGGVEVETEPVKVALHETVRAVAKGTGRHVKQSGGHGQFAIAHVVIEPLPEGGGFEFVDEVVGGSVPRQFIPSVEKGIRTQLERGVDGHPMVDVRIRLVDGKAHSVDSSDAAFQTAGAMALKDAAQAAGIQLLEPIDDVEITVADEHVGAVLSDLASRRGRVRGTAPAQHDGMTVVHAELPALELVRYPTVLRSIGHGSGSFTRAHSRHAPAPSAVQERLTETANA